MRVLLDTPVFVWWLANDRKLPKKAEPLILDPDNEIHVSAASVWEIAIKKALGQIQVDPSLLVASIPDSGFRELPVTARHAIETGKLPPASSRPVRSAARCAKPHRTHVPAVPRPAAGSLWRHRPDCLKIADRITMLNAAALQPGPLRT